MYLDYDIKIFTLATLLLCISCKPMNSSANKNFDKKKEKIGTATSNLPDRNYGSKLVYSRDTRSIQLFHLIGRDRLKRLDCDDIRFL